VRGVSNPPRDMEQGKDGWEGDIDSETIFCCAVSADNRGFNM